MRFIERYLKRARPEDVTVTDFRTFLAQRVEEHQTLEYKPRGLLVHKDDSIIRPRDSNEVIGFTALAKSVASMANAEGGLLILGVKERPEKIRGAVVKIRPGALSPLPLTITREIIENHLLASIQYPLENLTIVGVRITRTKTVYLIDVPPSDRAPHRVNERFYYQRYNFSSLEMKHYQIADMFGRRRASKLRLIGQFEARASINRGGSITFMGKIVLSLQNTGAGTAKSPFVEFTIQDDMFVLSQFGVDGNGYEGLARISSPGPSNVRQYGGSTSVVIHPQTLHPVTGLDFTLPKDPAEMPDLRLPYRVAAEDAPLAEGEVFFSGREAAELAMRSAGHMAPWLVPSAAQEPAG